jgi:tetratricopeptide (TPR) repeat protein
MEGKYCNVLALRYILSSVFAVITSVTVCAVGVRDPVQFSFENSAVNKALVTLYEQKPEIWKDDQLSLIARCYVAEKKFDQARSLYDKLVLTNALSAADLRIFGILHDMKGDYKKAEEYYRQAWLVGKDVGALKHLSVLKLRTKDMNGLRPFVNDLLANQMDNLDIQKILLAYALEIEDTKEGERVYTKVDIVRNFEKEQDVINKDAELRKLLLVVTKRYKDIAESEPKGR